MKQPLETMDQAWERMRQLIPCLSVLPDETAEVFEAVYKMGWMDGSVNGVAEGMQVCIDFMTPGEKRAN